MKVCISVSYSGVYFCHGIQHFRIRLMYRNIKKVIDDKSNIQIKVLVFCNITKIIWACKIHSVSFTARGQALQNVIWVSFDSWFSIWKKKKMVKYSREFNLMKKNLFLCSRKVNYYHSQKILFDFFFLFYLKQWKQHQIKIAWCLVKLMIFLGLIQLWPSVQLIYFEAHCNTFCWQSLLFTNEITYICIRSIVLFLAVV